MKDVKTKLTAVEQHAFNLGVKMTSKGFTEEDNPYITRATKDQAETWLLGAGKLQAMRSYTRRRAGHN